MLVLYPLFMVGSFARASKTFISKEGRVPAGSINGNCYVSEGARLLAVLSYFLLNLSRKKS